MNEAETRAELIDPALKAAGSGVVAASRVRREVITLGRLQGAGVRAAQDIADYVLTYRNHKLAVIEAKRRDLPDTEGVGQAKKYAEKLQTRFAYSTNGVGIYQVDMTTGAEQYVGQYPTPDELWNRVFAEQNLWRDRFAAIQFEDKGGYWQARYYQDIAIRRVLEAIAAGQDRILLTLATGTGKTFIAFQLAWKLFQSRWNLADWKREAEPTRRPRILFLADRNILADQAYNAFSAFPEDALVRIDPEIIRRRGRVPKNGNIFFTIFQTFMTGRDAAGQPAPSFGDYPPDFFDFIVIDECHRGGANDEGNWRAILNYFAPAVQLGLTATPKRQANADTYAYFGDPVYIYSLKDGINDGFLTPFKVKQIATTLDDYVYTSDDEVVEGEVEEGRRYSEGEFNRIIEIAAREKYRVKLFMWMPGCIRSFLPENRLIGRVRPRLRGIVQVVHRRAPPPSGAPFARSEAEGAEAPVDPPGQSGGGPATGWAPGIQRWCGNNLPGSEGRHGADPSPGSFASAPRPTPCRGTLAGSVSQRRRRASTPTAHA